MMRLMRFRQCQNLLERLFFLLSTREYKSTGLDVLNIAADYADFVTEVILRKTTDGD